MGWFLQLLFLCAIALQGALGGEPVIQSDDGNMVVQVDAGKQILLNADYGKVLINGSAVVTEAVLLDTVASLRTELLAYFLGPDVTVQISLSGSNNAALGSASLAAPPRFNMQPIHTFVAATLGTLALCAPAGAPAGSITAAITSPSGTVSVNVVPSASVNCLTLMAATASITTTLYPTLGMPTPGGLLGRLLASVQTAQAAATATLSTALGSTTATLSTSIGASSDGLSSALGLATSNLTAALGSTATALGGTIANVSTTLSTTVAGVAATLAATTASTAATTTALNGTLQATGQSLAAGLVTLSSNITGLSAGLATTLATTNTNVATVSAAVVAMGSMHASNFTAASTATVTANTALSASVVALGNTVAANLTSASTATAALGAALSTNVASVSAAVVTLGNAANSNFTVVSTATATLGAAISTNVASVSAAVVNVGNVANANFTAASSATAAGLATITGNVATVTAGLNVSVQSALTTLASTVTPNMVWRSDLAAALYGPEITYTVTVVNAINSALVATTTLVGPVSFGAQTANQFLASQLNQSGICQAAVPYVVSVVGNGQNLTAMLNTINVSLPCASPATALAGLPAALGWPTATPTVGALGRVYTAFRAGDATVNASLLTTASTLSAGIAAAMATDAATASALSAAVSTLQSRAGSTEGALATLSNSLTTQVSSVYQTISQTTLNTNQQITMLATDFNLTKNLSNALNLVNVALLNCTERGLVYSRTTNTCRAPISVVCGTDGPQLGVAFAPVGGQCRGSNVFGAATPCTIGCAAGYTGTTSTYTCGPDGLWAGTPPICALLTCGAINWAGLGVTVANVNTACTNTGNRFGDTCTATCKAGLDAAGSMLSATYTCGVSGTWTGGPAITCVLRSCGNLATSSAVALSGACTNTNFGATCSMACAPGFGLSGVSYQGTYTCSAAGTWALTSGAAATCPPNPLQRSYLAITNAASGCPTVVASGGVIVGIFFQPPNPNNWVWVVATAIRNTAGRPGDLVLTINGVEQSRGSSYTGIATWVSARVYWAGTVAPSSTIYAIVGNSGIWGCTGDSYDRMFVISLSASQPIRQIVFNDNRAGCPPAAAVGATLLSGTFTANFANSVVFIRGRMLRNFLGRADMYMYLDGNLVGLALGWTNTLNWDDLAMHWVGPVSAGVHTIALAGSQANAFGCGPTWGSIDLMVVDDPRAVKYFYVNDVGAVACPGARAAGATLMSFTFTQTSPDAVLWVAGSSIRLFNGRADLLLYIDGVMVNHWISFTESTQYMMGYVYYSGKLSVGSHTVSVAGAEANTWGCRDTPLWGSLSGILVGEPSS